jgi:hypothetical protein
MKTPLQENIIKLVSGQLSPLTSWYVRRKIHKNANLKQEYQDYLSLWQEIKGENTMEIREELHQEVLRNTIAREKKSEHRPSSADSSAMLPWTRLGISVGVCLSIATLVVTLTPARYETTGYIRSTNPYLNNITVLYELDMKYVDEITKIVATRHPIQIAPDMNFKEKADYSAVIVTVSGENPATITDFVNTYIEPVHLARAMSDAKIVDGVGKKIVASHFSVQRATEPRIPKSPNKAMILTIGLVAGILLGFLWAAKS